MKNLITFQFICLLAISAIWGQSSIAYRKGNLWGISNLKGKIVLEPAYDQLIVLNEELAMVKKEESWGVITVNGAEIVPIQFERINPYSLDPLVFRAVGAAGEGLYDAKGNEILPPKFRSIDKIGADLRYQCLLGDSVGELVNEASNEGVKTLPYTLMYPFSSSLPGTCVVRKGPADWALVNENYEMITPWFGVMMVEENSGVGKAMTKQNRVAGLYQFIGQDGTISDATYTSIGPFRNGLAKVTANEKVGFINGKGEIEIPLSYELNWKTGPHQNGDYFSCGLQPVTQFGLWGYINRKNEMVIEPQFTEAGKFVNDRAIVAMDVEGRLKMSLIDLKGKVVSKEEYGFIGEFQGGFAPAGRIIEKRNVAGFIDKDGNEVLPMKYADAVVHRDGWFVVAEEDFFGIVDSEGKVILPMEYDSVELEGGQGVAWPDDAYAKEMREAGLVWVEMDGAVGWINVRSGVRYFE